MNIRITQFSSVPALQCLAALAADFGAFSSGMHYGWSSPSLPKLLSDESHIPINDEEASWIATILLCGTVCGALSTGVVLDRFGRKCTLLMTTVPFFASWLLIAFSKTLWLLLVARFLAGIGDGLIQCGLPIYIGETVDPKVRGFFGSTISVLWFSGMLFINVIGSYLSIQVAALIASSIPILFLLSFVGMPDSPYYLIKENQLEKARKCLITLTGKQDVTEDINKIQNAVTTQSTNGTRYWDIFLSNANRKAFCLMLAMRTLQQTCGVISIMFYAQIIIKESSGMYFSPEIGSIIYFGMYVLFLVLCSTLVDITGRKPLLIISIVGSGLSLLLISCYLVLEVDTLPWLPITAILTYAAFFSLGMQSIPILMQAELFPVNIKAKAVSIYLAYFAVISTIVFKFFQVTSEKFGLYVPLFLFAFSCLIGLIFIILFVPETNGKTLEEIQLELTKTKKKDLAVIS